MQRRSCWGPVASRPRLCINSPCALTGPLYPADSMDSRSASPSFLGPSLQAVVDLAISTFFSPPGCTLTAYEEVNVC